MKLLRECAFDPCQPGHMKIIADVGDPKYYITRAIEELMTEEAACSLDWVTVGAIKTAIGLLVLALAVNERNASKYVQNS